MKKIAISIILIFFLLHAGTAQKVKDSPKMKPYIDNLMKQMTVTEKLRQLNQPAAVNIASGQSGSTDIA